MLTCTFENGKQASLRHVTVDILVLKDNQVLLAKRAKGLLEAGKWGSIGGFVERDETTKAAARREIKEESGYLVKDLTLLTIRDNPDRPHEDRQNISFVYFCTVGEKIGESDWEVVEQRWFPLNQLPKETEIAFDHAKNIQLYLDYLEKKFSLPYLP